MSTQPNFLVIGAARSGTTLLHSYLLQHPEIFIPKEKRPEPHFFLKTPLFEKGSDWYHERFFSQVNNEKAIGEISTSYFFGEKVPERIHSYNPDMQFLIMLREPKSRAFSNYWHSHKNGFEDLTFDEAIQKENERTAKLKGDLVEIAPYSYLGRSRYAQQFERFFKFFRKEQFHVCVFENFLQHPAEELNKMCSFLNVNDAFEWDVIEKKVNQSSPQDQKYSAETKAYLNAAFKPENTKLAEFFDLNLDAW